MRFSIYLPIWRDPSDPVPLRKTFEFVRLAEELGFDTATQGHHHFLMGNFSDPLTFLAALTGITSRLRFSTTIFQLPFHNPLRVAEQVAVIDQLSGGRAGIGVGTGWRELEYEAYGARYTDRGARMEEALQIMKLLWTQEKVSFQGRFTSFPELTLHPRPIQQPNPPLWVAGGVRAAIERAARLGDAWLCGPVESHDTILSMKRIYDAKCAEIGRPADWVLRRYAWISEDDVAIEREVLPEYIDGLLDHWRESNRDHDRAELLHRIDVLGEPVPVREIADARLLWGSPDRVIAQIRRLQAETGIDHLILGFGTGLPMRSRLNQSFGSFEEMSRMVRLFAREVMPAFH
nr:LLM class flavin-dependent oxidoreductase [Sphingomonas sp. Y57]